MRRNHIKWVNGRNQKQHEWIVEQCSRRGLGRSLWDSYVSGDEMDENDLARVQEVARKMENCWRAEQSRKKTCTLTISKRAQRSINAYCEKYQISAIQLIDAYALTLSKLPSVRTAESIKHTDMLTKRLITDAVEVHAAIENILKTTEELALECQKATIALKNTDALDLIDDAYVKMEANENEHPSLRAIQEQLETLQKFTKTAQMLLATRDHTPTFQSETVIPVTI